ncbi:MAG: amidohydrolase family protein [Thermodesulfovibrionales bacterium]
MDEFGRSAYNKPSDTGAATLMGIDSDMKGIIDFHTHAFPDELSERAMKILGEEGGIKASLDGRVSSLLHSMDSYGIEKSVVCSIATKPVQFDPIMSWCEKIRSERIIPFPSLHPGDPEFSGRISQIKSEGFKGIKFHPYYQDFEMDDEQMFPLYEKISQENLIVVMHTGFDFAFEKIRRADPLKILKVMKAFPHMKMVTTHLGSWDDWDEVEKYLAGKKIYMEISFSLEYLARDVAKRIILHHPKDHILFGTDSPWTDQGKTLSLLQELGLGDHLERRILRDNALNLLDSV